MKSICYLAFFVLLLIFSGRGFSQGKLFGSDEPLVYDLVPVNNLEIDADFYSEKYSGKVNIKLPKKQTQTLDINASYFNAPDLTLRYGLFKNFEIQFNTGYTGILTKSQTAIKIKKLKIVNVDHDLTGLNALSIGAKVGLLPEVGSAPSIAVTGIITTQTLGVPAFRPNNAGAELDLNMHNTFSDNFDIAYDAGASWSGFDADPLPSYSYTLTPNIAFSDDVGCFLSLYGFMQSGSSPVNRFDAGLSFAFGDNITADGYAGTDFQNAKNFFRFGASISLNFDFNSKHKK